MKDHLSFFCASPLIDENLDDFGNRFPDATNIYSRELRTLVKGIAKKEDIFLNEGVYGYMTGPAHV